MQPIPRSMLFTPATKSSHFDAGARAGADAVILDLEDSVAPRDKTAARRLAVEHLAAAPPSPVATALRINAPATASGWQDLTALLESRTDPDFVITPKADTAADAAPVKALLRQADKSARMIIIAETAAAAAYPGELCDARIVDAVLYGADDMCADLGAEPDAGVIRHARNVLLLHAAAGIPVIDAPFFDLGDSEGLQAAAASAVAEGFTGKAAIHPNQIAATNAAFTPTDAQTRWATDVLAANDAGAGTVAGVMVDEAVARRARRILSRTHH
nr:CoA ester lyase [Mycobacterium lepraemurium]